MDRQILEMAANHVTPVALELGGKSPNVVFPGADLDKALKRAVRRVPERGPDVLGGVAPPRARVYPRGLRAEGRGARGQNGARARAQGGLPDGTVVSRDQERSVLSYVALGKDEGAKLLVGGSKAEAPDLAAGNFVTPAIFDDVAPEMRIAREEIFGPVLTAGSFRTIDDLIDAANAVEFELLAGV